MRTHLPCIAAGFLFVVACDTLGECPSPDPDAFASVGFKWPDADVNGHSKSERTATCEVLAATQGMNGNGQATLDVQVSCTEQGSSVAAEERLSFTLPAGDTLNLAARDVVEMSSSIDAWFESESFRRLRLSREGTAVLMYAAHSSGGPGSPGCDYAAEVAQLFSEFRADLVHGGCDSADRDRLEIAATGGTVAVWDRGMGMLPDSYRVVVTHASTSSDQCAYDIAIYKRSAEA